MNWRVIWSLAFRVATALGVSSVAFVYFGMIASGKPLTARTAALAGLPDWYFWAALTPLVFWLGQRFPLERSRAPRSVALHLVAGVGVALLELLVFTAFNHWFYYNPWAPAPAAFWDAYAWNVLRSFQFAFIIYWLIVVAAQAFNFYHDLRQREAESARLELLNAELQAKLTQAQLDSLRAQLHPHFLFNTLNNIAGLVRERHNDQATDLIARLGQLLRVSLGRLDRNEITLREELDLIGNYVSIEQARFRDRLEVRFDIDSEALELRVPTMILQPLVENAIRHGLDELTRGRISIGARCEGEQLVLEVADSGRGAGPPNGDAWHSRVGLANTQERLAKLYGDGFRFDRRSAGGGTVVALRIPRRPFL